MTKRALFGLLVWLVAAGAHAQTPTPTPQTINPLPAQNASFFADLRFFLGYEDANRYVLGFEPFRLLGCTHGTGAGRVGSFTGPCIAVVGGQYVVDGAATIDYAALGATTTDFCWVALHVDTTTAVPGFTRLAGTHYLADCTSPSTSRPTLATVATYLMGVTIAGGSITAVEPLAAQRPWVNTYTSAAQIDTTRAGSFWMSDAGDLCYVTEGACRAVATTAGGCATCGDSATAFFTSGAIEPARGGTGDDTSGMTGVPYISVGNWSYEARLAAVRGGTGITTLGATGVPQIDAGVWSVQGYPRFVDTIRAADWAVDATQCTHEPDLVLNTGIVANVVTCADDSAGRIYATTKLPPNYDDGTNLTLVISAANGGLGTGVFALDVTCLCAIAGEAITEAGFPSAASWNVDFPLGEVGELSDSTVSMLCGGTCADNASVFIRAAVDAANTTLGTPTDARFFHLTVRAATDTVL